MPRTGSDSFGKFPRAEEGVSARARCAHPRAGGDRALFVPALYTADPRPRVRLVPQRRRGRNQAGVFSNAYNNLTEYTRWYQWGGDTIAPIASRPGEGGADMSRLTEILDDADHGGKIGLSDEDRRALYLWMDANVPFYGTAESGTRAAELEGRPVAMPPVQ